MRNYNLTDVKNKVNNEYEKVEILIDSLHVYKQPVNDLDGEIKDIKKELNEFKDKLNDLQNHTQYSINKAQEVTDMYKNNG